MTTKSQPTWAIELAYMLGIVATMSGVFFILRSCDPVVEQPIEIVAPDGGAEAIAIDTRLDAAVIRHEVEVQVIERTVIVRRIEYDNERDAEELGVRAQGRDAVAAWLTDFGRTVGTDGGVP